MTADPNIGPDADTNEIYLGKTPFCDPTDPDITSRVKEVVRSSEGRDAAEKLFEWVRENIAYYVIGLESAAGTLRRREGCCLAKTNLLVAMARAAGIPARYYIFNGRLASPDEEIAAVRLLHLVPELQVDGEWLSGDPAYESSLAEAYTTGELGKVTWEEVTTESRTHALPRWYSIGQRLAIYLSPGAWKVRRIVARAREKGV